MQDPKTRELLSFRVGMQEFCIDVMVVREIRGWTPATPLPHAPGYIRGVVNLRGAVLPIIDLAERIGLGRTNPTEHHVIVVARLGAQTVGLLVSAVCDILTVPVDQIQSTPDAATSATKQFIEGLLTVEDRMLGLLRIETVLPDAANEASREAPREAA